MFEILDRRTRLTGNQIKILSAAVIGDALEFSRLLVSDGGGGILFLRAGNQGQVDRADRPRIDGHRLMDMTRVRPGLPCKC
jgi:hypothetical protein